MTPSVPVQPSGAIPGPGSPLEETQFIYVAASGVFPFFPAARRRRHDRLQAARQRRRASSHSTSSCRSRTPTRPRRCRSASSRTAPESEDAEVLITTSSNLFLATTRDMDLTGEIDFDSDLVGGATASARRRPRPRARSTTSPTTRPPDRRAAQRRQDRPAADFPHDPANVGAPNSGVGQPAVSRGYVQFAGPDGVFVYRNSRRHPAGGRADRAGTGLDGRRRARRRGDARPTRAGSRRSSSAPTAARSALTTSPTPVARSRPTRRPTRSPSTPTTCPPARSCSTRSRATARSDRQRAAPRRVVPDPARAGRGHAAFGLFHPARRRRVPQRQPDAVGHRGRRSRRRLRALPGRRARALHRHDRALRLRLPPHRRRRRQDDARRDRDRHRRPDRRRAARRAGQPLHVAGRERAHHAAARRPQAVPLHDERPRADARGRLARAGLRPGDVAVVVKAGNKTISTRRAALTRTCGYRSSVSFRSRKRFTKSGSLTVRVRFLGNAVLGPRFAKSVAVRTR